jgi:DNA-binding HxlR family transcriptional regulator
MILKKEWNVEAGATARRTYGDACGIARALDVVGERWALLVVRELLLGPKRFTDLRAGLPNASQNVLSHRLRELEESGVIRRYRLPPPAPAWVYELTEWGRDLEPVLLSLAWFGSRVPLRSTADLSVDAMVIALETLFDAGAAGDLRARYDLRLGDDRFRVEIAGGRLDIARGHAEQPDAAIATDTATLRSLVFLGRDLDDAIGAGDATVAGDRDAIVRFLGCFPRPAPARGTPPAGTPATKTPAAGTAS